MPPGFARALLECNGAIVTTAIPAESALRNLLRQVELKPAQKRVVFRYGDLPTHQVHAQELLILAEEIGFHRYVYRQNRRIL